MTRKDQFHPDPLDVLADLHVMSPNQFWATYPRIRACVPRSCSPVVESAELLHYLSRAVHEDRQSRGRARPLPYPA